MARTSINPFLPQDSIDRRKSQAAPKKEIWSSLLNSVSSGKRLPEKQLILLGMFSDGENAHMVSNVDIGGSPESQKDFLESLSPDSAANRRHNSRKPPIANQYALGYTYQDVLDADHEGTEFKIQLSMR
jgi:dynein light intermediate chain 1